MDWYLMKNNYSSGFESDLINSAEDQYYEMTQMVGKIVVLYDSDLNEETKREVKGQIKGNHPNTKLKSMERVISFPIGTCKAGQYVLYKDNYWLITGFVDDDSICESALLLMCNYDLHWQDENGVEKHRFANIVSNAQYNTGITQYNNYTLQSDQLLITLPSDDDTLAIDEPMRFYIGYGKKKKVYKVTRPDTVPFYYGKNNGLVQVIVQQDRINNITDDSDKELCDYVESEKNNEFAIIGSNEIMANGGKYKYSLKGFDNTDSHNIVWTVNEDFVDLTVSLSNNNEVILNVESFEHIGKHFTLFAEYKGVTTELDILVTSFY